MIKKQDKNIVVYCSSRGDLPEDITSGGRLIGKVIGEAGGSLVYGGVDAGLMHIVAQAASENGAKVHGIVPGVFSHRADPLCTDITFTRDLSDRKGMMMTQADAFVVLPGGIGTIDEWISTLSHIMVSERTDPSADRPVLVWNHEGMYDSLIVALQQSDESIFGQGRNASRSRIFTSAVSLALALREILS